MKTFKFLFCPLVAALCLLTACEDTDELKKDVYGLENRVENLEALVQQLNNNVEAIQTIVEGSKVINEVEKEETADGTTYKLKLSDGETITLTQGKNGTVKIPNIIVNDKGNWEVEGTDLGVPAKGADAIPEFRIINGKWQVKFPGKQNFTPVLDESGREVSAVPEGGSPADALFENVTLEDGKLTITLGGNNGGTFSLPIVPDLLAEIIAPTEGDYDADNNTWRIDWGTEVKTEINVTDGSECFAIAPIGGWDVSIEEDLVSGKHYLKVKAPAQAAETRMDANNTTDLVLQVNKGMYWAIDKIKIEAGEPLDTPYKKFMAGKNLNIGGFIINNILYPNAVLLTESQTLDSDKDNIYFIEPNITLTLNRPANYKTKLIAIGNSEDKTATCKFANMPYFTDRPIVCRNITINIEKESLINHATVSKVIFYNCNINLTNTIKVNVKDMNLESLIIKDCRITGVAKNALVSNGGQKLLLCKDVIIENNIFYGNKDYNIQLLNTPDAKIDNLKMQNNTFVNATHSSGLIQVNTMDNYICENNVFYTEQTIASNWLVFNLGTGNTLPAYTPKKDNIYHSNQPWSIGSKPSSGGVAQINKVEENPFITTNPIDGNFALKTEYSEYGAHLNN